MRGKVENFLITNGEKHNYILDSINHEVTVAQTAWRHGFSDNIAFVPYLRKTKLIFTQKLHSQEIW